MTVITFSAGLGMLWLYFKKLVYILCTHLQSHLLKYHCCVSLFLFCSFLSDETIEVGADLCEIDTEATATVEASESSTSSS